MAEAGNGRGLSVAMSAPTVARCAAGACPKKKRPGGALPSGGYYDYFISPDCKIVVMDPQSRRVMRVLR
jgi:hypothetical protein